MNLKASASTAVFVSGGLSESGKIIFQPSIFDIWLYTKRLLTSRTDGVAVDPVLCVVNGDLFRRLSYGAL